MILTALLAGLAASMVLGRGSASQRLERLVVRPEETRRQVLGTKTLGRPLSVVAGLGVGLLMGGLSGLVVGVVVTFAGFWALSAAGSRSPDPLERDASLPLALDLLAACLTGGASPGAAVAAVAAATAGPLGVRLGLVAASLEVGAAPADAFGLLGADGPAGAAARTMRRAMDGGTPVAGAVSRVAEEARHAAVAAAERRAKKAGVKVLAPLATCFLPAFLLLGVVPVLYGIGVGLVSELS